MINIQRSDYERGLKYVKEICEGSILNYMYSTRINNNVIDIYKTFKIYIYKYIWTNQLSKSNKGMCTCGDKKSNDNMKVKHTTITTLNVCIPCSPTTIVMCIMLY